MTLRLAAISASASGDSATAAPSRATATTSAKLTGPVPTMTVFMPSMIACRPRAVARGTVHARSYSDNSQAGVWAAPAAQDVASWHPAMRPNQHAPVMVGLAARCARL